MIIKKSLKSVMPILKRCRASASGADDEESSSAKRKRRRIANGYYPLHLLGKAAAGVIPFNGYGIQKILSSSVAGRIGGCGNRSGNAPSESRSEKPDSKEVSRPPLVRTSRGRVRVLPSRFNDSILDNWKKEKSPNKNAEKDFALDTEYIPFKKKDIKLSCRTPRIRGDDTIRKRSQEKNGINQCRKFSPLSEEEIAELRNDGLTSCSKYGSPLDSSSSLHEHLEDEEEEYIEISGVSKLYSSKEFDEGDIVWAISGKNCPAWPAIVLNQESQVPQQVFNFRIMDTVCVMFFGYFGNGTQRVSFCLLPFLSNCNN